MAKPEPEPTARAAFLAPLARIAAEHPDIEAEVIWADASGRGWQIHAGAADRLDAEEIAFYAEGLLLEGFAMVWQVLADPDGATDPGLVRLCFWQHAAPPMPADGTILMQAEWTPRP